MLTFLNGCLLEVPLLMLCTKIFVEDVHSYAVIHKFIQLKFLPSIKIINAMDKTIKGEKDFVANYDIPILGNIPNFKTAAREEKK